MQLAEIGGLAAAVFAETGAKLSSEQDALDLLGETYGHAVDLLVVPAQRFDPAFFDLSTRLAGGFLQKMSNYGMRIAIVGDIEAHIARSASLSAFVVESNAAGRVLFVRDRAGLDRALAGKSPAA